MSLSVAVTGHTGTDIYTRYVPGRLSQTDDALQRELVYNLDVPAGAGLHLEMLHWFADNDKALSPKDQILKQVMLPTSLAFLHRYKWRDSSAIRIKRRAPLVVVEKPDNGQPQTAEEQDERHESLLVHYERTHQTNANRETAEKYLHDLFKRTTDGAPGSPNVFVIMGDRMPVVRLDKSNNPHAAGIHTALLRSLRDRRDQVTIICSAASLRRAGAAICRRLSWEQTIEDTIAEFRQCELVRALTGFRHLIILFGMVAALHFEARKGEQTSARLVFAPNARDLTFRDKFEDGETSAQMSSIAGFLLRELFRSPDNPRALGRDGVARALRDSLTVNMRWFDCGFPNPDSASCKSKRVEGSKAKCDFLQAYFDGNEKGGVNPKEILSKGYDELLRQGDIPRDRVLGQVDVDVQKLRAATRRQTHHRWQILRDEVNEKKLSRINLGIAICRFGHAEVLNRDLDHSASDGRPNHANEIKEVLRQPELLPLDGEVPDDQPLPEGARVAPPDRKLPHKAIQPGVASPYVPVIEFGNLVAIERQDLESFRSIRNLMKTYVEARPDAPIARRPMSIAVFGAPGSGKSFAVKQIARSINETSTGGAMRLETIEYNVAQFRAVDDLEHAITRIASLNNQQKIPLAFFDEFDCRFDGDQLGWLKYFLAPMQDGTFYGASQTISFGRAIFLFAGGVSQSLSDFNPYAKPTWRRTQAEKENVAKRREFFKSQKGPDFVSRLRGHIDILSVNPDRTAVKDEAGNPVKPVLRRAFTLRSQIVALGLYSDQDGFKVADVDDDVLYALLTVDKYRHGTRSMEAILQMCTPMEGGMIEKASLPSRAQLSMHVDADEFMARVLRGRFRRFLSDRELSKIQPTEVSPASSEQSQEGGRVEKLKEAAAAAEGKPHIEGEAKQDEGIKWQGAGEEI